MYPSDLKITPLPTPVLSILRLKTSRATALFVIPTTVGPTDCATLTAGVSLAADNFVDACAELFSAFKFFTFPFTADCEF